MQDKSSQKFSDNLREAMLLSGINAAKLSNLAGISKGYTSGILSGKKPIPSEKTVLKFSKVLECSPLWLVGKGENYANYEETMLRRKNTVNGETNDDRELSACNDWRLCFSEFAKDLPPNHLIDLTSILVDRKPNGYEALHKGLNALLKKKLAANAKK